MKLTSLLPQNYRNLASTTLEFSPGINIFVGQNGQGKTNVIEAIYALSLGRPFRNREKEIFIKHQEDFAKITGDVFLNEKETEHLEIIWENFNKKRNQTTFKRNNVEKNSADFLRHKHFFAVLFAPEDMELPHASPKYRRQYLSRVLSPLFPDFFSAVLKYEKVLRHRNKLLSEFPNGKVKRMEFDFWDTELVKWAQVMMQYSEEFFAFVSTRIAHKYRDLAHTEDTLSIRFTPSINAKEDFLKILEKNFNYDVRYGSTQKGPHRDDFELLLNDKPLETVGSRGEARSAVIALKLCEREFIAEHTSLFPVLLLDDVFSELDEARRQALLEVFQNDQVFISTTDLPNIPQQKNAAVFEVKDGEIMQL